MKGGTRTNIRILGKRKGEGKEAIFGTPGIIMCTKCRAVYFKKAWHESAEKFLAQSTKKPSIKFKLCPACTMAKEGLYEGIIILKDVPEKYRTAIIGLSKNFCAQATKRDPMDKLIAIKNVRNMFTITTTENQLAHKLAKHIIKSFKGARARTLYGKNDNVTTRVEITFPKTA